MWKKRDGLTTIEEVIQRNSGRTLEELLHPKNDSEIVNLTDAAKAICDAIRSKKQITIVGDYDADGICGAAILYKTMTAFGVTPIVRLPRRFSEGYGFRFSMLNERSDGLLITVDNGIAAVEEIAEAKQRGLRVVVLDHHLPREDGALPPADVIVDPHVFHSGGFRGKTPADILLENPDDREKLLNTRRFLASKEEQYASNKKQVEAIDDAIFLLDSGKLQKQSGARRSSVVHVYDVDHKYMRDTNAYGHRLFYSMSIACQYGNKYPWEVTIENMFAPGLPGPQGGLVPKVDEKSSSARCTFRLNDMEWMQLINRLNSDLQYFESCCYLGLYREAIGMDNNRRKAAKAQAGEAGEPFVSKAD